MTFYLDNFFIMTIWIVPFMYAIWSSVFAVGKLVIPFSSPFFLTAIRMLLGGILLLSFLLFRNKKAFQLQPRQWISLILLSIFSIFLTNVLEFWGLQYLSAAKTCFIYSLSPFFAALFSYLHFKEKMSRQKWLGMGIGIIGMIPAFMTQTGSEELLNAFSFFTWPTLAIVAAALFSVYGWVLLRLVVKQEEISPFMANGSSMFLGGCLALLFSFFVDPWHPTPIQEGKTGIFLFSTLGMTLVYNIFCYNLYGWLLKKFTATFLSFMGLLSPLFASIMSWLFLGETPSWHILLSTSIVSLGLWLTYQAELKQGYIASSPTKN